MQVRNQALWDTFREELADHIKLLAPLVQSGAELVDRGEWVNQIFRTLHTIKGASMLVPVGEVTRATHLVESLLEPSRSDATWWPQEGLQRYVKWLEDLVSSGAEAAAVLAEVDELEAALAIAVGGAADCRGGRRRQDSSLFAPAKSHRLLATADRRC